uniref:Lipocalin/cytosolic fatty-acid binding domain-containing protein n=1 Tax=Amblyomma maculatum TaxID=34609 RepID=G3MQD7_AMBMU
MKIFLILPIITVAVTDSLAEDQPNWADEKRFGDYQNAWKSLGQEEETLYYLTNTTYEDDTLSWGTNFSCVVVKETSKNESQKMVTSRFVFKNASSTKEEVFQVEESVKAVFFYNYTKNENAIEYLVDGNETYIDPLIYSDDACDIFYVPYANEKKGGLELWVNGDHINKVPQHCSFFIEYFRKKEDTVYTKYNAEECAEVVTKISSP